MGRDESFAEGSRRAGEISKEGNTVVQRMRRQLENLRHTHAEHLEEFFNVSREQLQSIYERMEGDGGASSDAAERPHGSLRKLLAEFNLADDSSPETDLSDALHTLAEKADEDNSGGLDFQEFEACASAVRLAALLALDGTV